MLLFHLNFIKYLPGEHKRVTDPKFLDGSIQKYTVYFSYVHIK